MPWTSDRFPPSMSHLPARSRPPKKLAGEAYSLYEQFRPPVPEGTRGWGAKGTLELEAIRKLAG